MERRELLHEISVKTGVSEDQVELTYDSMVSIIVDVLSRGKEVNLSPEWGNFVPKRWDNPALNENSPRTRKTACYKIRFRPGKELERGLKIPQDGDD